MAVHSLLEGIALPSEQVVTVQSVASVVAHAPVPRERAVSRPLGLVVELARVKHDFVHDLGNLDRVGRGAGTAALEGAGRRIRDVTLVVGRVQVLTVPARREVDRHAPAAAAWVLGEGLGV
ncbi:hypothetical protein RRF57_010651 [Xylaria bambusicola]|uniref:Uncharacterized protein n=1 Tax=Xylaria bambusicola TaxID=326684 RepID=A0AAN7Z2Y1_9PEZI